MLEIEAGGKPIVVMDDEPAGVLGGHSQERVQLSCEHGQATAIVNVASNFPRNILGIYDEVKVKLKVNEEVEVTPAERPKSLLFIRKKISGNRLTTPQM